MKNNWVKKSLVVSVILLFLGVAVAPSINVNVVKASDDNDLVEVTTQACGIKGYGNTTVKLSREQYQDLEQYLVEFRARLNKITTREEAVPIFKEAVVELNKYGLLPKGMSVEKAKELVIGGSQKQNILNLLEKVFTKYYKETNTSIVHNFFCLITGETNRTNFLKPIHWLIFNSFMLNDLLWLSPYVFLWLLSSLMIPLEAIVYFLTDTYTGFHSGLSIFFGNYPYSLDEYTPAQGWVSTIGLNGKKNITGSFWGQKIVNWWSNEEWEMNYTWRGCVGFTGLILTINTSTYTNYIGTALSVNIGPDRP
ncbi:MAG: hypothetical protein IMZ52_02495 [Actinobacteria bacterium]|nr:hypothetical protein [Actinomycetota bacterium]MBE3121989.1 hypothetical protein [Thermoplasmata archaeon]